MCTAREAAGRGGDSLPAAEAPRGSAARVAHTTRTHQAHSASRGAGGGRKRSGVGLAADASTAGFSAASSEILQARVELCP